MPTPTTFPVDLADDLRWGPHAELSPRLPYPPHHPPLLRRTAAEAEAAAPTRRGRLLPRRSRSRPRSAYPSHLHHHHHHHQPPPQQYSPFFHLIHHYHQHQQHHNQSHSSTFPESGLSRRDALEYVTATRGMNIMLDESRDWGSTRANTNARGYSARRRTQRRGVTRLGDFLAWSTGRRTHDVNRDEDDSLNLTYEQLLELDDGNVRCGLNKEQLAQLTTVTATKEHMAHDCHICLDSIVYGAKVVVLKCSHYFHKSCIHPWLKQKRTCPICRAEL